MNSTNAIMTAAESKQIRKRLDLNQQEFGIRLGFSEGGAKVRISEIETGKTPISKKTLMILKMLEKSNAV